MLVGDYKIQLEINNEIFFVTEQQVFNFFIKLWPILDLSSFLQCLLKSIHKLLGLEIWMHIAFQPVTIAKQIWAHFLAL